MDKTQTMTQYNLPWLLEKINRDEAPKFLFFWGHQTSKDGEITASCFSQWWESSFVVAGVTYTSAEHWMMAQKALLFDDQTTFDQIILSKTPAEAKKLGRAVQNFEQAKWEEKRFELVTMGNVHKFGQHPDLKTFLLNTQDRVLVEASPVDPIWGIGLAASDPMAQDPEQWKGLNLLGFALMAARDILRG